MTTFIMVTTKDGNEVMVRASAIRYASRTTIGGTCLEFSDNERLYVQESMERIFRTLHVHGCEVSRCMSQKRADACEVERQRQLALVREADDE